MNKNQIDGLREALKFSPDNIPLRLMLAEALYNLADYPAAEQEYKQLLSIENDHVQGRLGLAYTFYMQEKYEAALIVLEELEPQAPSAKLYLLQSKLSLVKNDLHKASECYERAVDMDASLEDINYRNDLNRRIQEADIAIPAGGLDNLEEQLFFRSVEKPDISFKDVGGMQAVKEEIALKVIHPIKNPDIYKAFGKKIGGGILMYGPPGVGKTMLARATAGEINANFISVGISEVLDMWIGSSEKKLHEVFQAARMSTPCVLFFDEVDALGASRSDMRRADGRFLINQFLDEMDGVKFSNDGILIMGATNSPWFLDTAFRRPGRFDRVVFIQPPDLEARTEILSLLLKDKPTEQLDIQQVARQTEEYSGADLKAVVDLAVESKLPESLKQNRVIPIQQADLKNAIRLHKPTTTEWFATARNYALYSNESGLYDDILKYLKLKK